MDIDGIRQICLAFPGATEQLQWEHHLLYKVGGKMFCISDLDEPGRVGFKVPDEDFETMTESARFISAPHLVRAKWVIVAQPETLKMRDWQNLLAQSYELVKAKLPKKIRMNL